MTFISVDILEGRLEEGNYDFMGGSLKKSLIMKRSNVGSSKVQLYQVIIG